MSVHRSVVLAAATSLVLLPGLAQAQACLGSPARAGQFTLGGQAEFSDGANVYGFDSQANLPGRGSMGARLGTIDLDGANDNLTTAGVNLAVDLGLSGLSFCPFVAPGYDSWSGTFGGVDVDYSRVTLPVGLGVGAPMGTGGAVTLIPSARAGLFHTRHRGSEGVPGGTFSRTDSTTDPFIDVGTTLFMGRVYARGGFFRIFQDDAENVLRLGVGVVF
jgi:hypothetical protein